METLVVRELYTLRNRKATKLADWVAYEVRAERIGPTQTRAWRADPELDEAETLEPEDYTGAHAELGTDRGHQAPLAAFTSHPEWRTTNYLSNITPQRSSLNQGPWMRLEARVRDAARREGVVFVVTGPLFERPMPMLPGADEPHVVPSGYWKVIATPDGRVASFLFDQETERSFDECAGATTLDEVEQRSGYDLLPLLGEPEGAPLRGARDELCPPGG